MSQFFFPSNLELQSKIELYGLPNPVKTMSSLKFFVNENNNRFSISNMSEPECYSISLCVEALLPSPKGNYWFEVDTCLLEEEDDSPSYGLVQCYQENPTPKDGSLGESRIPHPVPKELLDAVQGKRFHVDPIQYGLNPWGKSVEIVFESVKKGILASTLIAAALKH